MYRTHVRIVYAADTWSITITLHTHTVVLVRIEHYSEGQLPKNQQSEMVNKTKLLTNL